MILPTKIKIQVINKAGQTTPLANILFGLKIFTNDGGWHNISFLKSDSAGNIVLTKEEILENIQLNFHSFANANDSTRFELYIYDGIFMVNLTKSTKQLLELYKDKESIREDLIGRGIVENNLSAAIEATEKKYKEDLVFYERIKDGVNDSIQISPPKIEGVWSDTLPKQYQFVVAQKS
jgi:hypothetical protein